MTFSFRDVGENNSPTVLLLHGLGADKESWFYQTPALLTAGYRVVAVDLPGFGHSDVLNRRWTFRRVNAALIQLADDQHIPKFSVAGVSMGGALALQLALDYPGRIKNLVLVSTFASLRPQSRSEWLYFLKRGLTTFTHGPQRQANLVAERVFPHPEQEYFRKVLIENIHQANPRVYRRVMVEIVRLDRLRELKGIQIPTLVVSGAEDTTIPLHVQKRLAHAIPGAQHVVIPGGGHAVNVDHWEQFNQALLDFLVKNAEVGA